jgi:hypothetical protein
MDVRHVDLISETMVTGAQRPCDAAGAGVGHVGSRR